jgi:hypothetical protein
LRQIQLHGMGHEWQRDDQGNQQHTSITSISGVVLMSHNSGPSDVAIVRREMGRGPRQR